MISLGEVRVTRLSQISWRLKKIFLLLLIKQMTDVAHESRMRQLLVTH